MNPPKIFISYSWKPISNKQKVLQLAERLTSDFVHVIIDEWDLKAGQDKYQFMEQMVNNPDVIRVLLICNKDYAEKANSKTGGVGAESLIVSSQIYEEADQTKFIPIIFEYDELGKAYVPTFVNTRIFFDLSSDSVFEENYERLLRNIFDKPTSKRPPLGTIPAYLESDEPIFLPTAHKVATIKNALLNEKRNTPLYVQDYLDTFLQSLKLFEIKESDLNQNNYDEIIMNKIEELRYLRDDFINFLEVYLSFSISIDQEKLHSFFEKLLSYLINMEGANSDSNTFRYLKSDHFRFFYYELFITFSTVLLEKEMFSELAYMYQTPFMVEKNDRVEIMQYTFSEFRQYVYLLNEHRNKKYNLRRISVTADTLKQRATEKYNFDKLKQTDILLYYLSLFFLNRLVNYRLGYWFPETSCYESWGIRILPKTISQRYFDKIKILFDVENKDQLLKKAEEINEKREGNINDFNFRIPNIIDGLGIRDMCKFK